MSSQFLGIQFRYDLGNWKGFGADVQGWENLSVRGTEQGDISI